MIDFLEVLGISGGIAFVVCIIGLIIVTVFKSGDDLQTMEKRLRDEQGFDRHRELHNVVQYTAKHERRLTALEKEHKQLLAFISRGSKDPEFKDGDKVSSLDPSFSGLLYKPKYENDLAPFELTTNGLMVKLKRSQLPTILFVSEVYERANDRWTVHTLGELKSKGLL